MLPAGTGTFPLSSSSYPTPRIPVPPSPYSPNIIPAISASSARAALLSGVANSCLQLSNSSVPLGTGDSVRRSQAVRAPHLRPAARQEPQDGVQRSGVRGGAGRQHGGRRRAHRQVRQRPHRRHRH